MDRMLLKNNLSLTKNKLRNSKEFMHNYKHIVINLLFILIFGGVILISSCDDTLVGDEIDSRIIPSVNVDYYEHIQPVFNVKCTNALCHDDQTRAGGLSLTSYANATADVLIVFPYQPDASRLVWAIEGRGGTSPMPPVGYPPLTENQIEGIRTWIEEGAEVTPY